MSMGQSTVSSKLQKRKIQADFKNQIENQAYWKSLNSTNKIIEIHFLIIYKYTVNT